MTRRILVVDDDREMVRTLCDVLELHGWQPLAAHSGEEAVGLAAQSGVDIVLMDVRMPGLNGVEALRAIKANSPRTRVVLMTAYAARDLLAEAERDGALRIMPKPVALPELLALLDEARRQEETVLVVDDDPDFLHTLSDLLRARGIATAEAKSLDEALQRLERQAPSAVVLDLRLDQLAPLDVVLAVKRVSPEVLLILYSGSREALNETVAAIPSGLVHAALLKPFPIERLVELLG